MVTLHSRNTLLIFGTLPLGPELFVYELRGGRQSYQYQDDSANKYFEGISIQFFQIHGFLFKEPQEI
jgi:hypothetical protein